MTMDIRCKLCDEKMGEVKVKIVAHPISAIEEGVTLTIDPDEEADELRQEHSYQCDILFDQREAEENP